MRLPLLIVAIGLAVVFGMGATGLYDVTPQVGKISAASITHTTAGTADTVKALTGRARILVCTNSLDKEVELTYGGADLLYVPALAGVAVDLAASGLTFADAKTIGVYHLGVQPTTGRIGCSAF